MYRPQRMAFLFLSFVGTKTRQTFVLSCIAHTHVQLYVHLHTPLLPLLRFLPTWRDFQQGVGRTFHTAIALRFLDKMEIKCGFQSCFALKKESEDLKNRTLICPIGSRPPKMSVNILLILRDHLNCSFILSRYIQGIKFQGWYLPNQQH